MNNGIADLQLILEVVLRELLDDLLDVLLKTVTSIVADLDELLKRPLRNAFSPLTNCLILLISTEQASCPFGALELEL